MPLTPAQTEELDQIKADIERCELVLATTDGLGATHSDLGQSASYMPEQIRTAERRLPMLRARKRQLEAQAAGESSTNPYVNRGVLL